MILAKALILAAALSAVPFNPSPDTLSPIVGFNLTMQRCIEAGGPTDFAREQVLTGQGYVDNGTVRLECGDVEMYVPQSWLDAGLKASKK